MSLGTAALRYARHGWPVFPVQPRGKAPLTSDGFHAATTDEVTIAEWWRQWPKANIGFVPAQAGIIVIDVDGSEGETAAEQLGLFAEPTLTVATGRGLHVYFHHPGGHVGNRRLRPSLDVRADAGYVLLPPSVHPSGARYRRVLGTVDGIIELPPLVIAALHARDHSSSAELDLPPSLPIHAGTSRRRRYVVAAIEAECLEVANAPEGTRNNRLNEAAYSLARFAATGEADPAKLIDLLRFAAGHTGLPEDEIKRTISSAFGARGVPV